MRQHSTASLALRGLLVILVSAGLMFGGAIADRLLDTSPLGVLGFLVIGLLFGVVKIYRLITSSFPHSEPEERTANDVKPGAE